MLGRLVVGVVKIQLKPCSVSRPRPGCRLRISAGTRVATATGHQPGAGDTCNWGSGVMAQSRPAEHPLMVRRKTYPIKSLRNVLL